MLTSKLPLEGVQEADMGQRPCQGLCSDEDSVFLSPVLCTLFACWYTHCPQSWNPVFFFFLSVPLPIPSPASFLISAFLSFSWLSHFTFCCSLAVRSVSLWKHREDKLLTLVSGIQAPIFSGLSQGSAVMAEVACVSARAFPVRIKSLGNLVWKSASPVSVWTLPFSQGF